MEKEEFEKLVSVVISFGYEGTCWERTGHRHAKMNWVWQSSIPERVAHPHSQSALLPETSVNITILKP
jgi:hypothetical protein